MKRKRNTHTGQREKICAIMSQWMGADGAERRDRGVRQNQLDLGLWDGGVN